MFKTEEGHIVYLLVIKITNEPGKYKHGDFPSAKK